MILAGVRSTGDRSDGVSLLLTREEAELIGSGDGVVGVPLRALLAVSETLGFDAKDRRLYIAIISPELSVEQVAANMLSSTQVEVTYLEVG